MKKEKKMKKYFLIFVLAGISFMGDFSSLAMAEMSEQEMRLRALEEKQQANAQLLEILKRFSWYGNLRTRFQTESTETPGVTDERDRGRLRFRLGANVHMLKDLDIGFRMTTGGLTSRDGGNVTLDDGFSHKAFDLDQAFFRYQLTIAKWDAVLLGGKFLPTFMKSEIIWDDDVNVEGIGQQFSRKFGDTTLDANFGQFIYDEFDPGDDIIILGYQGILTQKTGLGKFRFAAAFYDVKNTEDVATTFSGTSLLSNTSEVRMLDLMGEWSEKVLGKELKLFGEYTRNIGDLASGNEDLDTAWQVGAKYGKSGKKFGDYDLKVIYRLVQTEAVFDVISDSDFHDGRSNARGFEAGGSLGLSKGVKLAITYFDTQEERGTKRENQKLQTDLIFSF